MPIEKKPANPNPIIYPPSAVRHYVGGKRGGSPTDTWETVAAQFHMDVKKLVRFNFKTDDPAVVNWYLRNYTGCNVPSPSGNNWTFKNADPGIIYIPTTVMDMEGEELEGTPGVTEPMEDPSDAFSSFHGLHLVHTILEGIEGASVVAEILALEGALGGLAVVGPIAGLFAEFFALGMGHGAALDKIKNEQAIWGLSYGIVLGIDDRTNGFIKNNNFHKRHVDSPQYREQEKNFEAAYLKFFVIGRAYGRKMNAKQRSSLRRALQSHMGTYPYGEDHWPARLWQRYYLEAAVAFRKYKLQM